LARPQRRNLYCTLQPIKLVSGLVWREDTLLAIQSIELSMKCFVHIGTEKTGSTTIQEFLHLNRCLLMQFECLFTKSAGIRNNIKLAVAAYNSDRRDDITRNYGLYSDKKLQLFQKKIIRGLQSELSRVAPPRLSFSHLSTSNHVFALPMR